MQALAEISEGMKGHLEVGFYEAIKKDMSPFMKDEEGMFYVFVYENAAEGLKTTIDELLMGEIMEMMDEMLEMVLSPELSAFADKWA